MQDNTPAKEPEKADSPEKAADESAPKKKAVHINDDVSKVFADDEEAEKARSLIKTIPGPGKISKAVLLQFKDFSAC